MIGNIETPTPEVTAHIVALTTLVQESNDKYKALETQNAIIRVDKQALQDKVNQFYSLYWTLSQQHASSSRLPIRPRQLFTTPDNGTLTNQSHLHSAPTSTMPLAKLTHADKTPHITLSTTKALTQATPLQQYQLHTPFIHPYT